MMKLLLAACLILIPLVARGESEIPREIDFETRDSESYRFEVTPHFGDFFGGHLNHYLVAGGSLQTNLIPQLGITTDFDYSQAHADQGGLLEQGIQNRNLYLISTGFVVTEPAAYRSGKKAVEADLFTTIGGGIVRFNNDNRGMGYLGGGIKTRFKKLSWFALRFDLRNYFYSIPNPGGSDFEYDLTLTIGPTFMLFPQP